MFRTHFRRIIFISRYSASIVVRCMLLFVKFRLVLFFSFRLIFVRAFRLFYYYYYFHSSLGSVSSVLHSVVVVVCLCCGWWWWWWWFFFSLAALAWYMCLLQGLYNISSGMWIEALDTFFIAIFSIFFPSAITESNF